MSDTLLKNLNISIKRNIADIQIGSIINNRFIIEEKIGSGGMGTVYKARDKRREEVNLASTFIAIKILNPDIRQHSKAFVVLQHEAAKAQTLSHPNIVRIHDFDRDGELAFITMEYLEGTTLAEILQNPTQNPLNQEQKIKIVLQLLSALQYAHQQNCIHADLKPSNIFILPDHTVKIIDFGIANAVQELPEPNTINKFMPESLHAYSTAYATTEIILGKKPTVKDDLYALSCIIYELFNATHPYQRQSAPKALEQNLVAAPISALTRSQWQELNKGLALKQRQRRTSIGQLLTVFSDHSNRQHYFLWLAIIILLGLLIAHYV